MYLQIVCKNCENVYIGKTGRSLDKGVEEQQKGQRAVEGKNYTRNERTQSVTEINKLAIKYHTVYDNHVIDWEGTRVVDRESHAMFRRVKEVIWIKREGTS